MISFSAKQSFPLNAIILSFPFSIFLSFIGHFLLCWVIIFQWKHFHVTFAKLKMYNILKGKKSTEQTIRNYMNHFICSSCEFFPTVYFQGTMIHFLNYFHFYFQISFKKAKLDFPSEPRRKQESLIPVGHRALLIGREFKLEDEK